MAGQRAVRARGSEAQEARLNYRHHYHAGNFADLVKHAVLLELLARLTAAGGPLTVIDTHAGAGRYDLHGDEARKSGEAEAGVGRLMAADGLPAALAALKAAVAAENAGGELRHYPGSPALIAGALRGGDRLIACELRADDSEALASELRRRAKAGVEVEVVAGDGYETLVAGRAGNGRRLALIDPPYERGDEYARVVEAAQADGQRGVDGVYAIWTPLKDLQTFDAFLGRIEALGRPALAVETRIRALDRPLRMNGCALVILGDANLLAAVEPAARAASSWVTDSLGGAGAQTHTALTGGD